MNSKDRKVPAPNAIPLGFSVPGRKDQLTRSQNWASPMKLIRGSRATALLTKAASFHLSLSTKVQYWTILRSWKAALWLASPVSHAHSQGVVVEPRLSLTWPASSPAQPCGALLWRTRFVRRGLLRPTSSWHSGTGTSCSEPPHPGWHPAAGGAPLPTLLPACAAARAVRQPRAAGASTMSHPAVVAAAPSAALAAQRSSGAPAEGAVLCGSRRGARRRASPRR